MITRRDSRDSSCLREIDALLLFRDGVTGMRSRLAIRAPIPLTTSMHSTVSYLSLSPPLLLSFSLYSLLKTIVVGIVASATTEEDYEWKGNKFQF